MDTEERSVYIESIEFWSAKYERVKAERDKAQQRALEAVDHAEYFESRSDKLQGERDEALEHEEDLFTVKNAACYWRRECERTTSERDEAREEASHWERVYRKDTALDLEVIRQLRQERDEAQSLSSRIAKERNRSIEKALEARHVAARLWQQCKAADRLVEYLEALAANHLVPEEDYICSRMMTVVAQYKAVCLKPREEAGDTRDKESGK